MKALSTNTGRLQAAGMLIFLLGAGASLAASLNIVADARDESPILFNYGMTPAPVSAPSSWTNESCRECHSKEYASWEKSRHALAANNDHFMVEVLDPGNRQQYCLNCHAPRTPGAELLATQEPAGLDSLYRTRPEWLRSGVDCLTCHVRDGKVLSTHVSVEGEAAHPMRLSPEMGRAEFCIGCHQFSMKDPYFPDSFRGHLQQESFDEFLRFRHAGNDIQRCHDCHMPMGDHFMPGGYSDEMVKTAVSLKLDTKWKPAGGLLDIDVTVEGGYVGHQIPGGEAFRYFTVVTLVEDAQGKPLRSFDSRSSEEKAASDRVFIGQWPRREKFQREQGLFELGKRDETPLQDTRLSAGELRTFRYTAQVDISFVKQPLRIRSALVYHLMDSVKAQMFHHSPEDVSRIIHEKAVTLDLRRSPGG